MILTQPTIASIVSLFTALLVAWTAYQTARVKNTVDVTAAKVDVTDKKVDAVHTLSNSAMGATLKMNVQLAASNAVMAHRLAEITGDPGDKAAAIALDIRTKEHETIYQQHLVQQAAVDAKQKAVNA